VAKDICFTGRYDTNLSCPCKTDFFGCQLFLWIRITEYVSLVMIFKFIPVQPPRILVCNLSLPGLAMSCVEAVPVFWHRLHLPLSGWMRYKVNAASYVGLTVEVRVGVWSMMLLNGKGPCS
jgi:hypothetical protein